VSEPFDRLWIGADLATMVAGDAPIRDGAIATRGETIAWVGARAALPGDASALAAEVIEVGGRWFTPGLVDPHTHVVFAGDRREELRRRLTGTTYAQVAAEGGGILGTVVATRAAYAPVSQRAMLDFVLRAMSKSSGATGPMIRTGLVTPPSRSATASWAP